MVNNRPSMIRSCIASLLLAFVACLPLYGDVVVEGDTKVPDYGIASLKATLKDSGKNTQYRWKVISGSPVKVIRFNERILFSGPPGVYKLTVTVVDFDTKVFDEAEVTVTIGSDFPPDPGPGPGPGPKPPDPPAPIPEGPLRVLIVFETGDLPLMDASQRDGILRNPKFQKMLTDRTDKNGPNKRGWNIWDKDQKGVQLMEKFWQDAFNRSRPSTPYIHLFKGDKAVYEGPLPKTSEETTNLITKYAGS